MSVRGRGETTNAVVFAAPNDTGKLCVQSTTPAYLRVEDLVAFDGTQAGPVSPTRLVDSRRGWGVPRGLQPTGKKLAIDLPTAGPTTGFVVVSVTTSWGRLHDNQGSLYAFPCGAEYSELSWGLLEENSLGYSASQQWILPVGPTAQVCLYSGAGPIVGKFHLKVDLIATFGTNAYAPMVPFSTPT
jgi:hypothetical protein